jgi:hypothetical protein
LLIGHIKNFGHDDGAWFVGDIVLSTEGANMRHFFAYLVDENDLIEFNGPADWLDENNWFLCETDTGTKKEISLPAIYVDDGSIYWRWRDSA